MGSDDTASLFPWEQSTADRSSPLPATRCKDIDVGPRTTVTLRFTLINNKVVARNSEEGRVTRSLGQGEAGVL